MRAVFDESYDDTARITCVAGYVFFDQQFLEFENTWEKLLSEYGISVFHASDCAAGRGEFEHLTNRPHLLYRQLIDTLKTKMLVGIAISVDETAFDEVNWPDGEHYFASAYSLCVTLSFALLSRYLDANGLSTEPVTYLLEAGNAHEKEANRFIDSIKSNQTQSGRYKYDTHAFSAKGTTHALEAADLLAWEYLQQCKRDSGLEKRQPRTSFRSLVERPHIIEHIDSSNIRLRIAAVMLEPFVLPPLQID